MASRQRAVYGYEFVSPEQRPSPRNFPPSSNIHGDVLGRDTPDGNQFVKTSLGPAFASDQEAPPEVVPGTGQG